MLSVADRQFVQAHLDEDPSGLLLSARRFPGVQVPLAVAQIEALRKVRFKVPSWYRFDLDFPPVISVEQASSEQTARFKAGLFTGHSMADLTGGMGVDAFFFAQHFDRVRYIEQNPELVAIARHNFARLGASNLECVESSAEAFLTSHTGGLDLIYIDPARRDDRQGRVFRLEDCKPNILKIRDLLLNAAPRVLIKTAPLFDLHLAVEQLGAVSHIWVVSVYNECKEVLYLLEKAPPPAGAIPIEAVCLAGATQRTFLFTREEERDGKPEFSPPQQFLYEPDAAILKAGAFQAFARRYRLAKLHPHTHLYTAQTLVPDLPGRCFQIEAVVKYDRKAVQPWTPEGRANIAARNFPDPVAVVRKRLRLADGGAVYLFAVTAWPDRKILIVCRRINTEAFE